MGHRESLHVSALWNKWCVFCFLLPAWVVEVTTSVFCSAECYNRCVGRVCGCVRPVKYDEEKLSARGAGVIACADYCNVLASRFHWGVYSKWII